MTFFDNGCTDCVMREGVPGMQWEGDVTKKGPFDMGCVGGLAASTRDEWMVFAPLSQSTSAEHACVWHVFGHV